MTMPRDNDNPSPTVQFLGGVQTVTGSMHLVRAGGCMILLDCGLYLGNRSEYRIRNRQFPFAVEDLDAVLLTHAHIDHCGNLPNLVRQGFRGPIYCTPATRDLLGVMLVDSARVQEKEAFSGAKPIYGGGEVDATLRQCEAVPYDRPLRLQPGIEFTFQDAGHVLGSAVVSVRFDVGGKDRSLAYTGDLGRQEMPFLHSPAKLPDVDLFLCESTYGGRYHPTRGEMIERLSAALDHAIRQGGKVLIPAFSLGRTQIVTHYLQKWIHEKRIPVAPIYVDSPLVKDIMEVYRNHPECLSDEGKSILDDDAKGSAHVHYVRNWEESKSLASKREPIIIVASGGMLDGGRALHHLQETIDDPRCCIVLVSYQAPGSLGRRLLKPGPQVSFAGKTWNKWAEVVEIQGFSGHADHDDFVQSFAPLVGRVGRIELVHGEVKSAQALAEELRDMGFPRVGIPHPDEVCGIGE